MVELKYIDSRPIYFTKLTHYNGGVKFPNEKNILICSDGEAKNLLNQKNGDINCWEKLKKEKENKIETLITEEV